MNCITLKKLEFDRVVNYTAQFCLSTMGYDRLMDVVPELNRELLIAELERVLELKNLLQEERVLPFDYLPDTRPHLKKLEVLESYLLPEELQDIYHLLYSAVQLRKFIFNCCDVYPLLNELTIKLWLEKSLQEGIRRVIDEQGRVRDTASDTLQMIRSQLTESREQLRRKIDHLFRRCQENGWLMDDTVAIKNGRLTLGLRVEYKNKVSGYIQDYSGTGQTVFIEPAETLEISNRIQDLNISDRREVERILKAMSDAIRLELENLRHNEMILSMFDALYARARFAVETQSVLPGIAQGHSLRIVKGFHAWLLISHRHKEVLPLDLDLSEHDRVLVISGPNAGGKSVAMKTVGLLCCMLVHGYLLPCSESSVVPLFKDIFIEIGDDQSIENDLSTFSSHLGEIKRIIEVAGSSDLVLIDELCGGTDVEEGSAIARAVIEELISRGSKTIVTTHIGELKAYAYERNGIVNGAMEFDRGRLIPTFRFMKGLPGNSFAFEMMQRVGFSCAMIAKASGFMTGERIGLDCMYDDLNRMFEENRLLKLRLESETASLEERKLLLQKTETLFEEKQRVLKLDASREILSEVESARKEIRNILHKVKNAPSDDNTLQDAKKTLGKKKFDAVKRLSEPFTEVEVPCDHNIHEGDLVRILDTNSYGEVENIQRHHVVVRCGYFRLTTSFKNLVKTSKTQAKKKLGKPEPRVGKQSWLAITRDIDSTRLDLRGLGGDEAIMKIDQFIDAMRLNRIYSATIVHGNGAGILRQKTTEFLQKQRFIKSFRSGEWSEGGTGVTIVELQ
ncbi:MAG: Smr/MutS family protein [Chlorobiaceae bacterium]